jgi:hypothetical protein
MRTSFKIQRFYFLDIASFVWAGFFHEHWREEAIDLALRLRYSTVKIFSIRTVEPFSVSYSHCYAVFDIFFCCDLYFLVMVRSGKWAQRD